MSNVLDVWLLNKKAGVLTQKEGHINFSYDEAYMQDQDARPLSVSLPFGEEGFTETKVRAFFGGLLPDDLVRKKLAKSLGVSEDNSFGLLDAIGGECAGAVSLLPSGSDLPVEDPDNVIALDEQGVFETLAELINRPMLAGKKDLRISLAGAQTKIAVRVGQDFEVSLMNGGAPTSHIIKPLITDLDGVEDSVHNELFCLRLSAAVGIPTAFADIKYALDMPYLLVRRYDRVWRGEHITRLHQEDFCQALGIPPELKYEREGGPSLEQSFGVIKNYSSRPAADRMIFTRLAIFNFLIGNADAHGKNFSLLYEDKVPVLAPAYDLLSTAIYESLASKMAMKIGGEYKPDFVMLRHWMRIIHDTALAQKALKREIETLSRAVLAGAKELKLKLEDDGITSNVYDKIITVIETRSTQLTSTV